MAVTHTVGIIRITTIVHESVSALLHLDEVVTNRYIDLKLTTGICLDSLAVLSSQVTVNIDHSILHGNGGAIEINNTRNGERADILEVNTAIRE